MLEKSMAVGIHLQSAQSPKPAASIPAWEQQPVTGGRLRSPEDERLLPVSQRASKPVKNGPVSGGRADIRQTQAVREISCELRSIRRMSFSAPQRAEIVNLPVALIQVRCTMDWSVTPSQ